MTAAGAGGLRVLIVEDEAIIAMMLEDMVGEMGFRVVGPVARVEEALAKLESDEIDCAVLDVNLNGQQSYPVADALATRNLPFLFITGYGRAGIQPQYGNRPVIDKPVAAAILARELGALAGDRSR